MLGDVVVLGCFRMIQRIFPKKGGNGGWWHDDINQTLGMMGKLCHRQVGDIIQYGDIIGLIRNKIPSGKHTQSYWKLQFIVDCPIKNGDFP